jgi:hypothetical protein
MTRRPFALGAAVLALALAAGAFLAGTLVPHQPSACRALQAAEQSRCLDVGPDGLAVVSFPRAEPCATCYTAEYFAEHPWAVYQEH